MDRITLTLPQFELKKEKIGSNYVQQIGIPRTIINGLIDTECEYRNYWKIRTGLDKPFDIVYIKQWSKRTEIINDIPILKLSSAIDLTSINQDTKLSWLQVPLHTPSPSEVVESWKNQFKYIQDDPIPG